MIAQTVRLVITCPNRFSRRYGKRIGEIEVSAEAISITDTRFCGWCREEHRQTLRIG